MNFHLGHAAPVSGDIIPSLLNTLNSDRNSESLFRSEFSVFVRFRVRILETGTTTPKTTKSEVDIMTRSELSEKLFFTLHSRH